MVLKNTYLHTVLHRVSLYVFVSKLGGCDLWQTSDSTKVQTLGAVGYLSKKNVNMHCSIRLVEAYLEMNECANSLQLGKVDEWIMIW